jgi:hypothetical protein
MALSSELRKEPSYDDTESKHMNMAKPHMCIVERGSQLLRKKSRVAE